MGVATQRWHVSIDGYKGIDGSASFMPIEGLTKDSTALGDAELAEMADLCAYGSCAFDVGFLSKQREEWVLVTQVRDNDQLMGFSFCTLERIGGTPALLVGVASIARGSQSDAALKALMRDQYHRALLAFPDEDVLVGTRLQGAGAYDVFAELEDVVPRPDHKASGEERAWGRRLAKRFGAEGRIDDRTFQLKGDGAMVGVLDYVPSDSGAGSSPEEEIAKLYEGLDCSMGDSLVVFGWAMAEDLASGKLGA